MLKARMEVSSHSRGNLQLCDNLHLCMCIGYLIKTNCVQVDWIGVLRIQKSSDGGVVVGLYDDDGGGEGGEWQRFHSYSSIHSLVHGNPSKYINCSLVLGPRTFFFF